MHVLEPGWEVPDVLPAGVTVAPAADPTTAARVIADRIGGELLIDLAAAERALANERSRRRATELVADAAEAARLCARLDELCARARPGAAEAVDAADVARLAAVAGDVVADPDELLAAAARLRSATVTAGAARRVVGDRPSTLTADIELVRARSIAADLDAALEHDAADTSHRGSAVAGVLAMSGGAALVAVGSGAPIVAGAALPLAATAALASRHHGHRREAVRLRAERDAAAAAVDRAHAAWVRARELEDEWQARVDAVRAADAELDDARLAWIEIVGSDDVPVERAERIADARRRLVKVARDIDVDVATPGSQLVFEVSRRARAQAEAAAGAAREREEVQARLRELLHGRRLDRLQAEAEAARSVLSSAPASPLVLCDPFAAVGRHRRRELLEDLARVEPGVTLAVVTSDEEALAWATARTRPATAAPVATGAR